MVLDSTSSGTDDYDVVARIVSEEYARRLKASGEPYPVDGIARSDVVFAAFTVLERYAASVQEPARGVARDVLLGQAPSRDRSFVELRFGDTALDYLVSSGLLERFTSSPTTGGRTYYRAPGRWDDKDLDPPSHHGNRRPRFSPSRS